MTKKLLITLFILALFASCGTRRRTATFDEGVVINGVRWATRNVDMPGTFTETPESFGMLFQWNSRKGWNVVDSYFPDWEHDDLFAFRYRPPNISWEKTNNPCPKGWRVPTITELQSLIDIGGTWTTQNGVNGYVFGIEPSQIFMPAVGHRHGNAFGALFDSGERGNYWSNLLYTWGAWNLVFIGEDYLFTTTSFPSFAYSVRCVSIN